MKTLKYILLGVILSSLVFSSFSFNPSKNSAAWSDQVKFCETYSQQELISKLDPGDSFFNWVQVQKKDPESSKIGICQKSDLQDLLDYCLGESFRALVPEDLKIVAGAAPKDQMIPIYVIHKSTSDNAFPMRQDLEELSVSKDESEDNYSLYITFSEAGAEKWASMTRLNIGKDIAILFKGEVIAAPRVREEIKHGKCMISGQFTESEINELKSAFEY